MDPPILELHAGVWLLHAGVWPRPRDSGRGSVCPVSKPPWGGKGHAADSLFLRPTLLCPRAAPTLNSPLHPSAPGSPQYSAYLLGRERTTQPSSG